MDLEAEARGDISPERTTIIEGTSGNTGIGLAMIAAAKGYECIITMPDTMSLERRVILKALGAKLVLTPAALGVKGVLRKAALIKEQYGDRGYLVSQFENVDNPKAHRYCCTSAKKKQNFHILTYNSTHGGSEKRLALRYGIRQRAR